MTLDGFISGYIEAALWSSPNPDHDTDPNAGEFLDASYGITDLAPETLAAMRDDCKRFYAAHRNLWDDAAPDDAQAGHDLWLTRNGHGAGYWDGDYPEPQGTMLTEAAKRFGGIDLYVGDDGMIYGGV